jgi:hypothetical protein
MNGASPLPPRITSTPASRRITMIGVSHHFLLLKMKWAN